METKVENLTAGVWHNDLKRSSNPKMIKECADTTIDLLDDEMFPIKVAALKNELATCCTHLTCCWRNSLLQVMVVTSQT